MSGRSGRVVSRHTHLVGRGGVYFAVSAAQLALVQRARGGAIHIKGAEVRSAQKLVSLQLATLQDDGAFGPTHSSNTDGERWTFEIAEGVEVIQ